MTTKTHKELKTALKKVEKVLTDLELPEKVLAGELSKNEALALIEKAEDILVFTRSLKKAIKSAESKKFWASPAGAETKRKAKETRDFNKKYWDDYDRKLAREREAAVEKAKTRHAAGLPPEMVSDYEGVPDSRYRFSHTDPKSGVNWYKLIHTYNY